MKKKLKKPAIPKPDPDLVHVAVQSDYNKNKK